MSRWLKPGPWCVAFVVMQSKLPEVGKKGGKTLPTKVYRFIEAGGRDVCRQVIPPPGQKGSGRATSMWICAPFRVGAQVFSFLSHDGQERSANSSIKSGFSAHQNVGLLLARYFGTALEGSAVAILIEYECAQLRRLSGLAIGHDFLSRCFFS